MQIDFQVFFRPLAACAALLLLAGCRGRESSRTITLDSEPPGSEIFLDGTSLGRTPCVISEVRLVQLGLKWPEYIHNGNSLSMNWELDTAGILVHLGKDGNASRKLFIKPGGNMASEFLTTETPWGEMAFVSELGRGGADDDHLSYHLGCMLAQNVNGLVLKISMPAGGVKPGAICTVTLAGREAAPAALACFRPMVEVYCSRFDEPAKAHTILKTALPDTWRFFKPVEENTATVSFPAPDAPGDYCVFAIVILHMEPSGEKIYQGLYSNGKLLHVER